MEENLDVCDISQMSFDSNQAITCGDLFLCGSTNIVNAEVNLIIDKNIFIDTETSISISAPPKGSNGEIGGPNNNGEDGANGETGKDLRLSVFGSLLPGSEKEIQVNLWGGDGGDGGRGGDGTKGENGKNGIQERMGRMVRMERMELMEKS